MTKNEKPTSVGQMDIAQSNERAGNTTLPTGPVWEAAKAERNWLVYKLAPKSGGKPNKIPQSEVGGNVGAKNAATLTFDEALQRAEEFGEGFGIGYLPREGSAMVCVDFDGVLKEAEVIQPDLPEFSSYAERSPSGTGLHVLVPRPENVEPRTFDDGDDWVGYIGSDSKFFTVSLEIWGVETEVRADPVVQWALSRTRPLRGEKTIRGGRRVNKVLDDEQQKSLQQLHEDDLRLHWFYKLLPAARAQCAAEMLGALPMLFAQNYDKWVAIGMALKLADANDELFYVWDTWSSTAPNYDGQTEYKWASFADGVKGCRAQSTIRSVIRWAEQNGWDPSPWEAAASAIDHQRITEAFAKLEGNQSVEAACDALIEPDEPRGQGQVQRADAIPANLTRPGGLVEALIAYGAERSPRVTRVPALAGALASTSALTARNYIIETPGFLTSPGLQIVMVGETGTGKETARDVVYQSCGPYKQIAISDSYASAPALHLALANSPTQFWANDEFGRHMKTASNAKTGAHDFGVITMAMKLHTMYDKYLPKKVYSQGADRERVDHPLLVAMHTTTPKALFDAMDVDTVVDGMLGRLLIIQQDGRPALKPLGKKNSASLPDNIRAAIDRYFSHMQSLALGQAFPMSEHIPGGDGPTENPDYWVPGEQKHRFIPIRSAEETIPLFEPIRQECEARISSGGVAAALWSRAYEQIVRVAGVVAFGHAVWTGTITQPEIRPADLLWARDVVFWSLDRLIPAAEEHASDGERDKLQKALLNNLSKLQKGPDGWVPRRDLLQAVKGRGRSYRELKDELRFLVEVGDIEIQLDDSGAPARPEKLRRGPNS